MFETTRGVRISIICSIAAMACALLLCSCRPDAGTQSPPPPHAASPTEPAATRPAPAPRAVDAEDDPNAPRELPRTGDLRGWIKTEPIRVYAPSQLEQVVADAQQLAIMKTYTIRRVSRCAYQNGSVRADLLLIETPAPEDAFGLFSTLTGAARQDRREDRSMVTSTRAGESYLLSGWQGTRCALGVVTGSTDASAERIGRQLLDRVVFSVPAADPPLLLRVLPRENAAALRLWLVRRTAALQLASDPVLREVADGDLDAILGLEGKTLLSIASVRLTESGPSELVWLAEYPDAASAGAAHARYRQRLERPARRLDRSTRVEFKGGVILYGTWTAASERHELMDLLASVLPAPQTAPAAPTATAPRAR